ncbi:MULTISPECIES: aldehyde dehydrogenase family protein [Pseudomonas]|jgi:aldehyde dehydrogenase (NAD+)|uniref:Aldehyde dehydrogenase family protein n=1 Tax=Pseudomonas carnis TaxID=2487355 RepID=A0ABT5RLW1_9PSED|nr:MULTISPECIES: aldehyde dehydrogenase family protein [Pseudomonas]MBH3368671.1 aldehyde dehydrogenase family protein [Pseudomonas carnis]MDD1946986.1 aldehyde dehydrogenase family protein [Pseudomonas carnis]MDI3185360.1 aldehyde dehydrogenase family protein [Pseudomonas paracarnis]NMZ38768.1 aldehyde dehydrogenase family protein [Pseudomonas proteolytica]
MREYLKFYIDGQWVEPSEALKTLDIENPANEEIVGRIALGSAADVDKACKAAKKAFGPWSNTKPEERIKVLQRILMEYQKRFGDLAKAITEEMGAPMSLSQSAQVPVGMAHLMSAVEVLRNFKFREERGKTLIVKEPIGVCGLITPWNWPMNQLVCKVAPAIATGCTMVLKPSEVSPFSAHIFAEIMHAAGVPAGVFNLIHGDGPTVGAAISSHPEVSMVSFTGSTRAGIEVAKAAAPTVKRVAQELGGKSANVILDDEAFGAAVTRGVTAMMMNSGQSCNAPSRMLVPQARMEEAILITRKVVSAITVGDPIGNNQLGPVVNKTQFDQIQKLILAGLDEGATLVAGGTGRPDGLEKGYFVKPTVFANVTNDMIIAREEIFGPVLSIIGYSTVDEAIDIANDTPYGLSGFVQSADVEKARSIALRLRAGQITINGANPDFAAPFGGYKMSGNGREWGEFGFHEFLETKSILGYA